MTNAAGEKYVFISDIHLGDERSCNPAQPGRYPYGWTNQNLSILQQFLEGLDSHPETQGYSGLIIAGDLLDTWVCPLQLDPPTFDDVLSAPQNKGVVAALNTIAHDKELWYIPGNHDMLIQTESNAVQEHIKNIRLVDSCGGARKYFYDGILVAEHGHRYCLFNAMDTWTRPTGHLPLGFFLARLATEGIYEHNKGVTFLEFLKQKMHDLLEQKAASARSIHLGAFVLDALKDYEEGMGSLCTPFYMNFLDKFRAQEEYDVIQNTFSRIYEVWDRNSGSGIPAFMAVLGDTSAVLRRSADMKYLLAGRLGLGKVRIALFGHSHEFEIHGGLLFKMGSPTPGKAAASRGLTRVIYGNCGTWIDTKPCTFIVTEKIARGGKNRIYVRGYTYDGSQCVPAGPQPAPIVV